ncbi:MAG TPA: HRDC domain-containing protein [Sphingobacteriaceae bacterium]|nr:HRDC domain-containing protein [Sphingobacteriaceae bacterium]
MKVKAFDIRISTKYLENDIKVINESIEFMDVKRILSEFIPGQIERWSIVIFCEEKKTVSTASRLDKVSYLKDTELTVDEKEIFAALKEWRLDQSTELGLPAYMICSDAELITVVKAKPESSEELLGLKGFGKYKIENFGNDIITILNSF